MQCATGYPDQAAVQAQGTRVLTTLLPAQGIRYHIFIQQCARSACGAAMQYLVTTPAL
jgi:hypothetical protein